MSSCRQSHLRALRAYCTVYILVQSFAHGVGCMIFARSWSPRQSENLTFVAVVRSGPCPDMGLAACSGRCGGWQLLALSLNRHGLTLSLAAASSRIPHVPSPLPSLNRTLTSSSTSTTMRSIAALLAFAASALAFQVTQPTNGTGWTITGPNTVAWDAVDTDPANFTIVLVNQVRGMLRGSGVCGLTNMMLERVPSHVASSQRPRAQKPREDHRQPS